MSDYEYKSGKLTPIGSFENDEQLISLIKKIIEDEGWKVNECLDLSKKEDAVECFYDRAYKEYYLCQKSGMIYKIDNVKELDPYSDVFSAFKGPDGSINFEVKFYNGGCSFDEALEISIKRMEEEQ